MAEDIVQQSEVATTELSKQEVTGWRATVAKAKEGLGRRLFNRPERPASDLAITEFDELYQGLNALFSSEPSIQDQEVKQRQIDVLTGKLLNSSVLPKILSRDTKVDTLELPDGTRVIRDGFIKDKEPVNATLDEVGEAIQKEMKKRGMQQKASVL